MINGIFDKNKETDFSASLEGKEDSVLISSIKLREWRVFFERYQR